MRPASRPISSCRVRRRSRSRKRRASRSPASMTPNRAACLSAWSIQLTSIRMPGHDHISLLSRRPQRCHRTPGQARFRGPGRRRRAGIPIWGADSTPLPLRVATESFGAAISTDPVVTLSVAEVFATAPLVRRPMRSIYCPTRGRPLVPIVVRLEICGRKAKSPTVRLSDVPWRSLIADRVWACRTNR